MVNKIDNNNISSSTSSIPDQYKWNIVWLNVIFFAILHVGALYGLYVAIFKAMGVTFLFAYAYGLIQGLGITAGAHRLWSHKAYKARWPLRLILAVFHSMAGQYSAIHWARDHRMHHKYSDTDADPYNASRGFFFSHIGWLFLKKHPEIKAKQHTIDMTDLWADPILRFQRKYYAILVLLMNIMSIYIPTLWGESVSNAFFVCVVFRYTCSLNLSFLVNSAAHMWGNRPYDKNIKPGEIKLLSLFTAGEGFHNYHHIFPWDYKAAELGISIFNLTTLFINLMAAIGWAYDLKTAPIEVIQQRKIRTGDEK